MMFLFTVYTLDSFFLLWTAALESLNYLRKTPLFSVYPCSFLPSHLGILSFSDSLLSDCEVIFRSLFFFQRGNTSLGFILYCDLSSSPLCDWLWWFRIPNPDSNYIMLTWSHKFSTVCTPLDTFFRVEWFGGLPRNAYYSGTARIVLIRFSPPKSICIYSTGIDVCLHIMLYAANYVA